MRAVFERDPSRVRDLLSKPEINLSLRNNMGKSAEEIAVLQIGYAKEKESAKLSDVQNAEECLRLIKEKIEIYLRSD